MDFGKLSDISKVDFSLPQEDRFYFEGKEEESIQILLGAPGWSVPKWKGVLYPRGTQSSDFGVYYSQQFATIEFNPKLRLISCLIFKKSGTDTYCVVFFIYI